MTTKSIQLPNGTIEFVTDGQGPLVVLLHGAGASAVANWQSTIDALKGRFRVVAINLPSAGNTVWAEDAIDFDALTEAVLAVAGAETNDVFHLVGYSTGAMLAIHAAARQPERVGSLVAIAPWLTNDARTQFFFNFWGRLLTTDASLFAEFNTLTALSQTAHTYMNAEAFTQTAESFVNTGFNADLLRLIRLNVETVSVAEDLPLIKARTTIVGFSDDRICPIHYARQVANGIAGATFVEINAGHAGPWEATEAMNLAIREVLTGSGC